MAEQDSNPDLPVPGLVPSASEWVDTGGINQSSFPPGPPPAIAFKEKAGQMIGSFPQAPPAGQRVCMPSA